MKLKTKKTIPVVAGTILAIVSIIYIGVYFVVKEAGPTEQFPVSGELEGEALERAQEVQEVLKEDSEAKKRENEVGRIFPQLETGLNSEDRENVDPHQVVIVMHKMTHQKISAPEKIGAIPMTHENIKEARQFLEVSVAINRLDVGIYRSLSEILSKWERADFSTIHHDQDYILEYMGASIGYSNGLATPEEEELFILNNFGEEYLYTMDLEPLK